MIKKDVKSPTCPYCLKQSVLLEVDNRKIWACIDCDASVGCHKGTDAPLGSLANKELRGFRIKAHEAFDKLWSNATERRKCYSWLAKEMGIKVKNCHIAMFNVEQCKKVIEIADKRRKENLIMATKSKQKNTKPQKGFLYKIEQKQKKLKMVLWGESGSGKTLTALIIADTLRSLMGQEHKKIALINSEGNRASDYADMFAGKKLYGYDLPSYTLQCYVETLDNMASAYYDELFCVVVDSFTHCWAGSGGALEMAHQFAMKKYKGNTFSGWGDVTPEYNRLAHKIVNYPINIIGTIRAKEKSTMTKTDGKTVIEEMGIQPIHKDQFQYEFNQNFQIEYNRLTVNRSSITKNPRYEQGETFTFAQVDELCKDLMAWMVAGVESDENLLNYQLKTASKSEYLTMVIDEMEAFVDPSSKSKTWENIKAAGTKHGFDLANNFENCDRLEVWNALKQENDELLNGLGSSEETPVGEVEFDDLEIATKQLEM